MTNQFSNQPSKLHFFYRQLPIILGGVIMIIITGGIFVWQYFGMVEESEVPKEEIINEEIVEELTSATALLLLNDMLGYRDCLPEGSELYYSSCVIDISKEKYEGIITVTYDGLKDDSIKAERFRALIMYQNGEWVRGDVFREQQCWPGRGHQNFSTEFCL